MKNKILNFLLRLIFGLFLIALGLKGLSEVNSNKNDILNTVESFEKFISKPYNLNINLHLLKQHPIEILYFENISILYSGFLMIFGLSLSKAFLLIAFLIESTFQKNLLYSFSLDRLYSLSIFASLVVGASTF